MLSASRSLLSARGVIASLLCALLRPDDAPTVCEALSSRVILVGEDHSQSAGPATVGRLLASSEVCRVPIDCVLLELDSVPEACSAPRPGACRRVEMPTYQRRMLTPFLLNSARRAGATVKAIDHAKTYESYANGETMDRQWLLYGRSEWMADKILTSGCARAVVLVGYAHNESERSIPWLLEGRGVVPTTVRATCGSPSWDLSRSFSGGVSGRAVVPCDDSGPVDPRNSR